jgi:ribosomal-protein-alanine N-acetyltransferase
VDDDEVVGMVAVRTAAGEAEILNLAVAPAQRRRGAGRLLVEAAIAAVKAEGAGRVYLEVRESNAAARSFYANLDFVESGRRRNYYCSPTEDALVLLRTVEQPAAPKNL